MKCSTASIVTAALLAGLAGSSAHAGIFSDNNIVVMRVGHSNVGGGGDVILDEYTRTGSAVGNQIVLPTSGPDAFSAADVMDHDRHLHRSTNGQYLTLTGYNAAPGPSDPAAGTSARVVGVVNQSGSVDLSTKLTDAYQPGTIRNAIRGAFTTDGNAIWTGGDNSGDSSTTGGLRYTTLGSSTTVNLSRTQINGGSPQADNVRDVGVYGSQLFDSSGSGSSIGKGVLKVGTGMPTSGSQSVTALETDNVSVSCFAMLDLNPSIAGVDTLFTATDASVRKYILQGNGTWLASGTVATIANNSVEQIIAGVNANGSVSVFFAGTSAVLSFNDPTPATGSIAGITASTIVTAPVGYTLGGIEFVPTPAPGAFALLVAAAPVALRRRRTV